jgi:hypothetical protein
MTILRFGTSWQSVSGVGSAEWRFRWITRKGRCLDLVVNGDGGLDACLRASGVLASRQ